MNERFAIDIPTNQMILEEGYSVVQECNIGFFL